MAFRPRRPHVVDAPGGIAVDRLQELFVESYSRPAAIITGMLLEEEGPPHLVDQEQPRCFDGGVRVVRR